MILGGLFRKIKWIIILVVVVTIIYWIIRLWKWKPLIKEMINKEVSLAEAVSRLGKGSPDAGSENNAEIKDGDFDYLSRRLGDFFSGPHRHPVRSSNQEPLQDITVNDNGDSDEKEDEPKPIPRKGRDPIRRSNSKVSTYKREEICRKVFEDYFDDYFPTCRPRFLANPKTGHPLEMDGYNARLNLCFEYHGPQHRIFPNPFHKTEAEFDAQIERDQFKRERLAELGIDLIEIWDDVPTDRIKDFIHLQIKKLGK